VLKETIEILDLNIKRARSDFLEIKSWNELIPLFFNNDNKRRVIDSFIFRFIKIQDLMGEKLFKEILSTLGEYKRSMSFIDVLDKMEQLELINSANKWNDYRELRNELSHEYPMDEDETIKDITMALTAFGEIEIIFSSLKKYLQNKSII
jgi:hypothetical protein